MTEGWERRRNARKKARAAALRAGNPWPPVKNDPRDTNVGSINMGINARDDRGYGAYQNPLRK